MARITLAASFPPLLCLLLAAPASAGGGRPVLPEGPALSAEVPLRAGVPADRAALPPPVDPDAPPAAVRTPWRGERTAVEHDAPGDGSLWARGATYKAGFSAEGAVYAPFLGSRAPRSFPVRFRLTEASAGGAPIAFDPSAAPGREGDLVRFDRGGIDELYLLSLESVEQRFEIAALPARGEVLLRVAVETELAAREEADAFRFENELGAVRYGRATAFDAAGRSVAAPTALTAQGIEIRVPADFVATARLPLLIDPVVSTFVVDGSTIDSYYPDVAYCKVADRWLAVYEEFFSATDHDVRYRLLNAGGASIQTGYVEVSLSLYWANPAVACLDDAFLVVAEVGLPSSGQRKIEGRIYNGVTATMGGSQGVGSFGISGSLETKDMVNPDVGGRSGNGLQSFCVVWERVWSPGDNDILFRRVSPGGGGIGSGYSFIDASFATLDGGPSISKVNNTGRWNVVWHRQNATHHDLRGARINEDGVVASSSFAIDASISETHQPTASSCLAGTERWMVACHEFGGGSWDVTLRALDGATVLDAVNLGSLEVLAGQSAGGQHQLRPDVETDGESFAVAYAESTANPSDWNAFVATVSLVGDQIQLGEGHRILAGSFTEEDHLSLASRGAMGGALRRYFAIWDNRVASHSNVEGGLYDGFLYASFCHPGVEVVAPCPCGNAPSAWGRGCNNSSNTGGGQLSLFGLSSLAGDTLNLSANSLKPNALAIFNQGDLALNFGLPFGQGMRCVGGSIKRLYMTTSLSGGSASVPQAGDPDVHSRSAALGDVIAPGTTRGYYVYYRDPVVLGGCNPASTYNATQAVQALWVP